MKKFLVILGVVGSISGFAQRVVNPVERAGEVQFNTIYTAVPFLMIGPDSRSGAMGDGGVALSPDANSMHWNASKLAFAEGSGEIAVNYNPWMRSLVPDMNMAFISGYFRNNDRSTFGGAMRYFSLGEINFTDNQGNSTGQFKPNEFSLDVAYAMKFSERMSGGITTRFIQSNLTGGISNNNGDGKPGRSLAGDISMYYINDDIKVADYNAELSFGANLSNIGTKMRYSESQVANFLPTNLKVGSALLLEMDETNSLTFHLELNKLMVPTPPLTQRDSATGENVIVAGRDPNVSVASGMFGSFSDAPGEALYNENGEFVGIRPGSVRAEEFKEVNISFGTEYWYMNQFAMRAGFFYENLTKGNRKYVTLGGGLKYTSFDVNLSYLVSLTQNNPLANTWRFSLLFNLDLASASGKEGN